MMADYLHLIQAEWHFHAFIGGGQETECVEGKLKLRTDANENATFGFDPVLPAELKGQDVFVVIRLAKEEEDKIFRAN